MSTDECSNLCATFSGYFVNKINNLKHSILNKLCSFTVKPQFVEQPHTGPQFESIPLVTPAEVQKLLTSIPSESCKLDFILTSLLKSFSNVFSELICTLANLSFVEGCFPAIFKQAIVNPLIKKPGLDKSEPSNFCPISNLKNIWKLLEWLFLTRFQPHISNSPNFNQLQSAYRKFHSTLLNTLDQVYTAADSSQPTVLMSLDLSAAFDIIDHHILLSRLQASFGVSIGRISSYLTGRVQRVVVGLSQSANTFLSTEVPQSSVLGPLLFLIFTSPVGHIICSSGVRHQQYGISNIQNTLARVVTNTSKFEPITPILKKLHWLLIKQCIDCKLCLLTYKTLQIQQPTYLYNSLSFPSHSLSTRSSDSLVLSIPYVRTSLGKRAFSVIAPRLWNSLPPDTRNSLSVSTFRSKLKTHLFKLAFPLEFSPILSSDCLPGFDSCFSFTFSPIEWYLVLDTGH